MRRASPEGQDGRRTQRLRYSTVLIMAVPELTLGAPGRIVIRPALAWRRAGQAETGVVVPVVRVVPVAGAGAEDRMRNSLSMASKVTDAILEQRWSAGLHRRIKRWASAGYANSQLSHLTGLSANPAINKAYCQKLSATGLRAKLGTEALIARCPPYQGH